MLAAAKITDPEVVRQLMQMPNIPEEENWSCAPHKRVSPVKAQCSCLQSYLSRGIPCLQCDCLSILHCRRFENLVVSRNTVPCEFADSLVLCVQYPVGKEMNLYQAGKMAQFVLGMTAKVGRKEVSVQNEKRRVKRNAKYLAYLEKELRSDMQ